MTLKSDPKLQLKYPLEETAIKFFGDQNSHPLGQKLSEAFFKALAMSTKLPEGLVHMNGFSGKKFRYLMNALVGSVPDARYLEIGTWTGSTLCSALYGNKAVSTAIDNWSQFGGPKDTFLNNIKILRQTSPDVNLSFLEEDFNKIDYSKLGKFNIYFYDGPHELADQINGVKLAQPALDDVYIQIVDDWNWKEVVQGTQQALTDLKIQVLFSIEITTARDYPDDQPFPAIANEQSEWHNGYFIAVCQKSS